MKVLARHYLCFAGQLCGVSTDGTGFTAIVSMSWVLSLPLQLEAAGTYKRASRHAARLLSLLSTRV